MTSLLAVMLNFSVASVYAADLTAVKTALVSGNKEALQSTIAQIVNDNGTLDNADITELMNFIVENESIVVNESTMAEWGQIIGEMTAKGKEDKISQEFAQAAVDAIYQIISAKVSKERGIALAIVLSDAINKTLAALNPEKAALRATVAPLIDEVKVALLSGDKAAMRAALQRIVNENGTLNNADIAELMRFVVENESIVVNENTMNDWGEMIGEMNANGKEDDVSQEFAQTAVDAIYEVISARTAREDGIKLATILAESINRTLEDKNPDKANERATFPPNEDGTTVSGRPVTGEGVTDNTNQTAIDNADETGINNSNLNSALQGISNGRGSPGSGGGGGVGGPPGDDGDGGTPDDGDGIPVSPGAN
jgi:uncharacterized protein YwlG (UPF0340 family)